jgi:hypothetical protein
MRGWDGEGVRRKLVTGCVSQPFPQAAQIPRRKLRPQVGATC